MAAPGYGEEPLTVPPANRTGEIRRRFALGRVWAATRSPGGHLPARRADLPRTAGGRTHGVGEPGWLTSDRERASAHGGPDRAGVAGVENRSLGRGRVSVPVVGLGTWRRLEAAAAAGQHRELVEAAIAAGIRVIDTSPMYGGRRAAALRRAGRPPRAGLRRRQGLDSLGGRRRSAALPGGGLVRRPGRPDADPQPGGLAGAPARCSRPPGTGGWSA